LRIRGNAIPFGNPKFINEAIALELTFTVLAALPG